jgi:hypothetical protein
LQAWRVEENKQMMILNADYRSVAALAVTRSLASIAADRLAAIIARVASTLLAGCIAFACFQDARAQDSEYSEVSVKAAYLVHFLGYVEWASVKPQADVLTIGVIGNRDVAAELQRILPGRSVAGRSLRVRELGASDDFSAVNILYVGSSQSANLPAYAARARQQHILLVSDTELGLEKGATINFVNQDRRIRFEISLRAAEETGIKLSSRLLSAAIRLKRSNLFFRGRTVLVGLCSDQPGLA